MAVVTNQPIQLSYFVADIATAVLTYNRLRWHRSRTGQNGTYEAATGTAATSAVLTTPNAEPHQLNGRTLSFTVDGTNTFNVTFASADPVTTLQAVGEINTATGATLTAADDGNGAIQLTATSTGSASSIEILNGDANPFLGLSEGDGAIGLDADTVLVGGTHQYFYTDSNSDAAFWYRVEFFNAGTSETTGLGVPFPANQTDRIPYSNTIVGYLRMSDLSGAALEGRKVTFYNAGVPNNVAVVQGQTTTDWTVGRQFAQITTDRNGYAEIRLLRGITVDLNIEGGFARRITVPTSGDAFHLLDPSLQTQDEFGIQEPNIPFAVRTT